MSNVLQYKGYLASIEFSAEDRCLYGKIEYINDLIMFEGGDFEQVESAFREAVDGYLLFCKEQNKTPDQPFKGTFNVRIGSVLHKRAAIEAKKAGISLNDLVSKAIETYIDSTRAIQPQNYLHVERKTISFATQRPVNPHQSIDIVVAELSETRGACH